MSQTRWARVGCRRDSSVSRAFVEIYANKKRIHKNVVDCSGGVSNQVVRLLVVESAMEVNTLLLLRNPNLVPKANTSVGV